MVLGNNPKLNQSKYEPIAVTGGAGRCEPWSRSLVTMVRKFKNLRDRAEFR